MYTQEERETAIKEIEEAPIVVKEWEGPNETKVTSLNISMLHLSGKERVVFKPS